MASTAMANSGPIAVPASAIQAYQYFVQQGLTPAQSAGIVGNFMQESGVNPNATNSIGATGIAQWLGSRLTNLYSFAQGLGQPANSLQTQLLYSWYELNGSENGSLVALKQTSTPAAAATVIFNDYERAGDSSLPARIANANAVYQAGTGQSAPIGSATLASATSGNDNSSSSGSSDCTIGWTWPSAGPIGGGKVCIWRPGWTRALLGGVCIAGAGVIMVVAVASLAGSEVKIPSAPTSLITSLTNSSGRKKRNASRQQLSSDIDSGKVNFPISDTEFN
jgi:hypothetical protein